jgi:hypothetical protein
MSNASSLEVFASFLGFVIGIPAGIVAGMRHTRTKKLWGFIGICLVLGIVLYRTGLATVFFIPINATIWFVITTDVTRRVSWTFTRRQESDLPRSTVGLDPHSPASSTERATGTPNAADKSAIDALPGQIAECPNCRTRVCVTAEGTCPSCRRLFRKAST